MTASARQTSIRVAWAFALALGLGLALGLAASDAHAVDRPLSTTEAGKSTQAAPANGWSGSGKNWKYYRAGKAVKSQWVITATAPMKGTPAGLQRYWIDANGKLAVNRLVNPSAKRDKGSYYAFATPKGYVVRGKYTANKGKTVYVANNDGRLPNAGWLVTRAYDGDWQRYYINAKTRAVRVGLFAVSGSYYYGIPSAGYVVRGKHAAGSNMYLANNNGQLEKAGWLVTKAYDGDWQRYRIDAKTHAAKMGFFAVSGAKYYGIPKRGYVLRGKLTYDSDTKLIADNDGKMPTKAGWLVTGAYDKGVMQRYFISAVDSAHKSFYGARTGRFNIGGKDYFGRFDQGYVVRGAYRWGGVTYRGDNDGVLYGLRTLNGVDISNWQAGIDVARIDADFVIIKATQGNWYKNPYFKQWANKVLASGKLLGFYHFADGKGGAAGEAKYFVNAIKPYIGKAVLVLDWEGSVMGKGTGYAKTWLDTVYNQTGVRAMVYMSKSPTHEYDWSRIAPNHRLWVAQYANYNVTGYQSHPWTDSFSYGAWKKPTMFQYSGNGRVNGYSGAIDLDVFYGSKALWNTIAERG